MHIIIDGSHVIDADVDLDDADGDGDVACGCRRSYGVDAAVDVQMDIYIYM